jgi:hypothetical protein
MCRLLLGNLVELNNVHHDGGNRYQVDGNLRFRLWRQPARLGGVGKHAAFAGPGGRKSRKPVNQAQVLSWIGVGAGEGRKMAKIGVNLGQESGVRGQEAETAEVPWSDQASVPT